MKKLLYIIAVVLMSVSCHRRPLTYDYDPTVEVILNVDWSDMSEQPTGMSVYCYPEDGGEATVSTTNINSMQSSVTLKLGAGVYNILTFNQSVSEYSSLGFDGMESYETATIHGATTTSKWAASKADSELIRNPTELAAATYLDLEITEDAVRDIVEMRSKVDTKAEDLVYTTISVDAKVVVKTSRVKIKLDGIQNFRSARATLYGMAASYNFAEQSSCTTRVTHLVEEWTSTVYDGDYRYGEITAFHTSFGMPGQTTLTRAEDYSDWDGEMKIDYLLADNKTQFSETYDLGGHVTLAEDQIVKADGDESTDPNAEADIYIDLGDDSTTTLPDVKPEGGATGGFDATIDDWGDEESFDVPI